MRSNFLIATAMLLTSIVVPAKAEVAIENIRLCYGPLGPVRETMTIGAYDTMYLSFDIVGLKVDEDDSAKVLIRFQVKGPNGAQLMDQKKELKTPVPLGGGQIPVFYNLVLSEEMADGEYTVILIVEDQIESIRTTIERKIQLQKTGLSIVSPQFSYDQEGKFNSPLGGVVGQTVFAKFKVINFERKDGKIDAVFTMELQDENGVKTKQKPFTIVMKEDDAKKVEQIDTLFFTAPFLLNRPGNFKLKVEVKDKLANKSTTLTLPVKVTDFGR